jgi:isoleucyl-tRNA synthetase
MKDIICRYKLLRGYKIYNTCGFESFGIKIEHAAMTRYY